MKPAKGQARVLETRQFDFRAPPFVTTLFYSYLQKQRTPNNNISRCCQPWKKVCENWILTCASLPFFREKSQRVWIREISIFFSSLFSWHYSDINEQSYSAAFRVQVRADQLSCLWLDCGEPVIGLVKHSFTSSASLAHPLSPKETE